MFTCMSILMCVPTLGKLSLSLNNELEFAVNFISKSKFMMCVNHTMSLIG